MAEIKNPNQQANAGSSTTMLVMMVVFLGVFFGLRYFGPKKQPTPATPAQQQQAQQHQEALQQATTPAVTSPTAASVAAEGEQTTTIENAVYRITFTNRGAQVTHWILKDYKDSHGAPLDLVHKTAAAKYGYPLSLYSYDTGAMAKLNSGLYVASATGNITAPATLTFTYAAGGLEVKKTFTFDNTYVLGSRIEVKQNGSPVRALLSWPAGFGDQENASHHTYDQLDSSQNGSETHVAAKKVSGGNTLNGPFDWAGVSDLHFAAIFLPDNPATASVVTLNHPIDVSKDGDGKNILSLPSLGAGMGDVSGASSLRIFAGPKAVSVLKNIKAADGKTTLEPLLDFGFFGFFGKYLFLALQAVHKYVPNWGWSIIVLTVIINLILLPLRYKTMQSALKMQRIQPQMDAIKAKYAKYKVTDPKRAEMNAEIMDLQKREGVNVFGGCLPTLIQLPLLFAFLGMLPKVVELRGAHWYWLHDLTAADPYHILPIIMIVSQFLMQFYTPSPGMDPAQQKMMAFMMPAFSGYITWNYASGLALYWSIGNLIGIIQQQVMNRTSLGREMKQLAAKRARRRQPATIQGRR
ncbi:membrane protein insertase YidC [Terriglobus albidus]|uniref:membrane protein insertase YidC n=1 Tax=Terriglobus albidus TaxID=1592106 RepID=UPI0021E0CF01|nr:membrane protein insertase YidC [Terriglobus albidus]